MYYIQRCLIPVLVLGIATAIPSAFARAEDTPTTLPSVEPTTSLGSLGGATVTVRVVDPAGNPVTGATVTITSVPPGKPAKSGKASKSSAITKPGKGVKAAKGAKSAKNAGVAVGTGTTDDKGVAVLSSIPAGQYQVGATVGATGKPAISALTISAGDAADTATVTLTKKAAASKPAAGKKKAAKK